MDGSQPLTGASGRHERFANEYVVDFNGQKAAVRAGYAESSARSQASRLLTNDNIIARTEYLKQQVLDEVKYDATQHLKDALAILKFDFRQLYDDNGDMLPPHEWPDDAVMAVAGIDVSSIRMASSTREDDPMDLWTKRVKFSDKMKALDQIGKNVNVRAFDNTLKLELPPKVIRNFMGRKRKDKSK